MLIACASLQPDPPCIAQWREMSVDVHMFTSLDNSAHNHGVVSSYHRLYNVAKEQGAEILCLVHDDVDLLERGFDRRVAREFDDPQVAIVGLGGAVGIGTDDLYRRPYAIEQLIRIGYRSNQTDWQTHGAHETGACDVAVVDGFFMAVRRSFLDKIGGFAWIKSDLHVYDLALCLMALRRGYRVRMVGVRCTHRGGGSTTLPAYKEHCERRGSTMELDHSEPHKWLASEFMDVMPYRV